MIHTLYAKLSLALLAIFSVVGVLFLAIANWSTERYYEEVTQRLNRDIPMYVTEADPLIENGAVDQQALKQLADKVMTINPSVEVYLLDPAGGILGHAVPDGGVERQQVNLEPIRDFLANRSPLPVKGDDPRHLSEAKIFSVAPVQHSGSLHGYLYTIFGGSKYDALAAEIKQSYVLKVSGWAILATLLFAFLTALVIFAALTKRLRKLTAAMEQFKASEFTSMKTMSPVSDKGDEIDRLSQSFDEMSTRMVAQLEALKQTDRLRRELTANISHDLRTPLALMQGYIETLLIKRDSISNTRQLQYLNIASKHANYLTRLVGQLFELAKLEADVVTPNIERFALAELVHDVTQQFQIAAQQKNITLTARCEQTDLFVRGDIALIERALENLLDNALRNTPGGGSVVVNAALRQDGTVNVAVKDTGFGIPADKLPRIFERAFRIEKTNGQDTRQSTGLGLAIVKRILELHDSAISVESRTDAGTCFRFSLSA
ncbi:MAG: HAMP domain-containing sensor histidine kinase [Gammaproteobacteria bacterium]